VKTLMNKNLLFRFLVMFPLLVGPCAYAQDDRTREILVGGDFDAFSFTGPAQTLSLAYRTPVHEKFTVEVDGYGYNRFGSDAGRGGLAVTYQPTHRTTLTVGGSAGPSNLVAARGETFVEASHGFDLFHRGLLRGIEVDYHQGYLWFQNSHVSMFAPGAILYMPKDWMLLLRINEARNGPSSQSTNWATGGMARLTFPMVRKIRPDILYANGAENMMLADQVGRFSARTYGGGARYMIGAHEIGTHVYYQNRSQGQSAITTSMNYSFRF
jgi:YaiO family outer membrane protein